MRSKRWKCSNQSEKFFQTIICVCLPWFHWICRRIATWIFLLPHLHAHTCRFCVIINAKSKTTRWTFSVFTRCGSSENEKGSGVLDGSKRRKGLKKKSQKHLLCTHFLKGEPDATLIICVCYRIVRLMSWSNRLCGTRRFRTWWCQYKGRKVRVHFYWVNLIQTD